MPGLLDAFKQYVRDALPGGALNREVTPQGLLDAASIATIPVPVVGDVTGLAADLYRMRDPQERTPLNLGLAALGALPLVPPVLSVARKGDKVADVLRAADRVPAPQEAALETARRNAVKMLGLPENNTAMDRARALGFETAPSKAVYHGSREPFEGVVDVSRSDLGFHAGTLGQAEQRLRAFARPTEMYPEGANIMPLMKSKYANMLRVSDEGTFHADSMAPQFAKKKLVSKEWAKLAQDEIGKNIDKRQEYDAVLRRVLTDNGYDGVRYANAQEGEGLSYAFTNPAVLRSRFAAFDPARINENDLLGRADPALLAILAGGGLLGGGAYYLSDR